MDDAAAIRSWSWSNEPGSGRRYSVRSGGRRRRRDLVLLPEQGDHVGGIRRQFRVLAQDFLHQPFVPRPAAEVDVRLGQFDQVLPKVRVVPRGKELGQVGGPGLGQDGLELVQDGVQPPQLGGRQRVGR